VIWPRSQPWSCGEGRDAWRGLSRAGLDLHQPTPLRSSNLAGRRRRPCSGSIGYDSLVRIATPDEELRDALAGRSSGKSVSRTYGAKRMLQRWGVKALKEAIDKISYPGLDLSRVRPLGGVKRTRGTKAKRPSSRKRGTER
jgi:hypothetical protein